MSVSIFAPALAEDHWSYKTTLKFKLQTVKTAHTALNLNHCIELMIKELKTYRTAATTYE